MPVVPFTALPNQSQPIPKVDQTYLMMAAAELHEAGCLFEPTPMTTSPNISTRPTVDVSRNHPDYKRQREAYDNWKNIGTENERVKLSPEQD